MQLPEQRGVVLPDGREPGYEALVGHAGGQQRLALPVKDVTFYEGEPQLDHGDVSHQRRLRVAEQQLVPLALVGQAGSFDGDGNVVVFQILGERF
jgi:hypothetical protein